MYGIAAAMSEANKKLMSMGYTPVYCGLTSLGCVMAWRGKHSALADHSFPVEGALVWFGNEQQSGQALYYIQPVN